MTAQQQAAAKVAFQKFALAELRATNTPGAVSSYEELLAPTGLSGAQQASFAELYFAHGNDPAGLWEKAAALGIPKDKIELLKLQGCLFQLTLNNAKLTEILQNEVGALEHLGWGAMAVQHRQAAPSEFGEKTINHSRALKALASRRHSHRPCPEQRLSASSRRAAGGSPWP